MNPTPFGDVTHSVVEKKEMHKLQESFAVTVDNGDVYVGQPVKLDPDNDGCVLALDPSDDTMACIGIAEHDTNIDAYENGQTPINSMKDTYSVKRVTVSMRAYAIVIGLAESNGFGSPTTGVVPGPVKYMGYEEDDELYFPQKGRAKYANVDPSDATDRIKTIGWALGSGEVGDEIKVALCL